ncbi:MAG: LPS assembly protein LptD, partial [Chitinivibrionales bacterium]|nr:LPS assembly protein LptD [Chitinivibrionales bacterium]
LDLASRKGLGTGLEYRFVLREGSWGKVYGYFANEENRYFDHEYRDERDREKERGYVNFEGEHYFTEDFYVKALISHVTDREFYGDYAGKVRRSMAAAQKRDIKYREMDESFVFLNKNWEFYNLLANVNFYKNLIHRDPYALQRAPQIVFSGTKRPLAGTPLFYQIETRYDHLWREEGIRAQRLDFFPKLSFPVNYKGWLKFNPEVGVKGITYLDLHNKEKNYDEEGLFPSVEAELTTTLLRIFDVDRGRLKKLKHAVEPGLLYEYVPENDQSDYPYFDIPDRFFKRHSFGYYLKSRFTALLFDSAGELHEREIGYVNVGQVFNISRPKGGIYLQGDPDEDFSDVFAEVRVNIFPTTYIKLKASYNPYEHNLRYYNAYVNWTTGSGEFLKLEYRYGRDWFETIDFEGRFKLTSSLYAFFDATYDNLEDKDMDTEFGLDYAAQCWGSIVSIETSRGTGGRSSDTSVNFTFYLRGFGGTLY